MNEAQRKHLDAIHAYQAANDVRVICQSPKHDEPVEVATYTRVGTLSKPGTVREREDFEPRGAGIAKPGEQTLKHDAGHHSTRLTHDGNQRLEPNDPRAQSQGARGHHELECAQCGDKMSVRDENLQPELKKMQGRAQVLTLRMLRTLLENK